MSIVPSVNVTETGKNIKDLRKKAGLSVKDMQELFGFSSPQAIYKWQNGISLPSIDNLFALSEIFGIPVEEIVALNRGNTEYE